MSNKGLPRHIAIIMDGNGRWAKKRFLPRFAGHRAGVSALRRIVECCSEKGIEALTLFAFSSENWRRPEEEVSLLMSLFVTTLGRETQKLHKNNVRLRVIGDTSAFPQKLQDIIAESEALTKNNQGLNLLVAANYGGRWDIMQAMQTLAVQIEAGELTSGQLTEDMLGSHLSFADLPEPDLFIRTGGEERVSNFMLWQLAYSELYFTPTLWPDFGEQSLNEALQSYANRERRFGHTSEQIEAASEVEPVD